MEGVEGEPKNIGYTAPKNAMYNRLVVVRKGREEVRKGAWHPESVVHNVLNMCHKGRWHWFGGELAQIGTGVRLQRLLQQTSGLITACPTIKALETQRVGGSWDAFVAKLRIRGHMYNSLPLASHKYRLCFCPSTLDVARGTSHPCRPFFLRQW